MWKIRTLALSGGIVLVFGSPPVFARGGGQSGGGGMEVVTRAGMVVTLLATEGIMEVMPATRMDGLQRAQRRGITSRIRILVPLLIRFQRIASNSARSSGRGFQPKRPRTGWSPGLSSITLKA